MLPTERSPIFLCLLEPILDGLGRCLSLLQHLLHFLSESIELIWVCEVPGLAAIMDANGSSTAIVWVGQNLQEGTIRTHAIQCRYHEHSAFHFVLQYHLHCVTEAKPPTILAHLVFLLFVISPIGEAEVKSEGIWPEEVKTEGFFVGKRGKNLLHGRMLLCERHARRPVPPNVLPNIASNVHNLWH
jgi:hypothetical protein